MLPRYPPTRGSTIVSFIRGGELVVFPRPPHCTEPALDVPLGHQKYLRDPLVNLISR